LYPRLLRIIFDYYSIPAIVNHYKRSFNSIKLIVDNLKYSFSVESINIIESLKF
ncbi:hypothetical protein B0H65DRAFT_418453, partial [Neurospora tetraspora]